MQLHQIANGEQVNIITCETFISIMGDFELTNELCDEMEVVRNAKIGKLPVLPVEVQVIYSSSRFRWPSVLIIVYNPFL